MSNNGNGFVHSVPVPKLYKTAVSLLKRYCNKEGSIKTLIYGMTSKRDQRNHKRLMAMLTKATTHFSSINKALDDVQLFKEQPMFDQHLAVILTSEMMQKGGSLCGDCKPIHVINSYGKELMDRLGNCQIEEKELSPRFAKINTLLISDIKIHRKLRHLGRKLLRYDFKNTSYDDFLGLVKNLDESSYLLDYHIPHLFVFPPKSEVEQSDLYEDRLLLLQDKASCLSAFVADVKPGDVVIDACAAPGNKTSHLAALMQNEGRIIAIDKDPKRFEILKTFLNDRGVTCAETINQDFTQVDPADYKDVNVILVDPSCSSSGTHVHGDKLSEERLTRLSYFQLRVLSHALSFPSVSKVIYSTCSVHEKENEQVVQEALSSFETSFQLEDLTPLLKQWKQFGSEEYPCGPMCLRTNPEVDRCQGFFVAKFIRRKDSSHEDHCSPPKKKKMKKQTVFGT